MTEPKQPTRPSPRENEESWISPNCYEKMDTDVTGESRGICQQESVGAKSVLLVFVDLQLGLLGPKDLYVVQVCETPRLETSTLPETLKQLFMYIKVM